MFAERIMTICLAALKRDTAIAAIILLWSVHPATAGTQALLKSVSPRPSSLSEAALFGRAVTDLLSGNDDAATNRVLPDKQLENRGNRNDGCNDCGLYRDPLEVLGSRFTRARTANLCENNVKVIADNLLDDMRFTRRGAKLCTEVCAHYENIVARNRVGTDVQAFPGFCKKDGPELSTSCSCLIKTISSDCTEISMYKFEADLSGNLRVSVGEITRSMYLT